MHEKEWYIIDNIENFVESTRVLIFDAFGKTDNHELDKLKLNIADLSTDEHSELDSVLTQNECMVIAKNLLKKKRSKKGIVYVVNNRIYSQIVESFNSRLVSNILSNLVNQGILESAFDPNKNDFIFWIKDDENNQNQETPETD